MSVNQADIFKALEKACLNLDKDEFIYSFLDAFAFPKSTITRLRNNDSGRNIGVDGDIGLKRQLYFRAVSEGQDIHAEIDSLKTFDVVVRHNVRFVIVTDFKAFAAYDLVADERLEIDIPELYKEYGFFLPLAGYEKAVVTSEHPADIKAATQMSKLFDMIKEQNDLTNEEDIHALNVFLARLLFCFFAEDTGIFENNQMTNAIKSYTKIDGSDVDEFFYALFNVLNLELDSDKRKELPSYLQSFKYVNGGLFESDEPVPQFNRSARRVLIDCGSLDWSEINPDIFGSMFQAVIDEEQRGNLGQHYTSVSNIMKVIQPLFLDGLYEDLNKANSNEKKLKELLVRLQGIRVFDPACGSGNFLIIAYKELRNLEMEVINALNIVSKQEVIYYSGISLTQFYGIEIDDFACEIAMLSLWLAEHQMNLVFEEEFGYTEASLPLKSGGNVVQGNSLRLDWKEVCPLTDQKGKQLEVYICGNPPFLGTTDRTPEQREDIKYVFEGFKSLGYLDFVAAWFWKSAQYIQGNNAKSGLVATNSICQGEQVSTLWNPIFNLNLSIDYCYRTFPWRNSARDNAAVHVIIVGIKNSNDNSSKPRIYDVVNNDTHVSSVDNISPYLVSGANLAITRRSTPFGKVSKMIFGNKPTDGGNLYLTENERNNFILKYPEKAHWIRQILGSREFLHNEIRWCFWLADVPLEDVMQIEELAVRCNKIRDLRIEAGHSAALRGAEKPHTFLQVAQPKEGNYILVPRVSSERRPYVPMGFLSSDIISSDANQMISNASLYEFGILTSEMHNDWMRVVAGRLKSDYRYSGTLVYNTFPWPEASEAKRKNIEQLAEEVLLTREDYPDKTLAQLYDPDLMPDALLKAHQTLDKAVEALYRDTPFRNSAERVEHLFNRYEKLIKEEQNNKRK